MNTALLDQHISNFKKKLSTNATLDQEHYEERRQRVTFYQAWDEERIKNMTPDDVYEYLSKLWAMLIWGNKHYAVEKIITDNTLEKFKEELVNLLFSKIDIEERWNRFRKEIKGMGPAMISEILCHNYPNDFMIWNRRAHIGLDYLGVENLPSYDYQLTGKRYKKLSEVAKEIAVRLENKGFKDHTLLTVDYFIWDELQVVEKLSTFKKEKETEEEEIKFAKFDTKEASAVAEFKHNDIRDKLAEIGTWLGFSANTERKVADGAIVDTLWEATIGNMGRVIYVFEVQTSGSIDSLILNLLRASNNPAVQGLVAVSDLIQIEKIRREVSQIHPLSLKLKYWDYTEVLQVHQQLAYSYSAINQLGLVPQGF